VPDRNYREWWSSNDITSTVRETVREVEVPLVSGVPAGMPGRAPAMGSLSLGLDTSLEEMFHLAPSALAGKL